jgi:SAM-dependent methyltransferase
VTSLPAYVNARGLFGRHGFEALDWQCRTLLDDAADELAEGEALEIGAGEGLMSLWMLHAGARAVTSLEPEAAGATGGVAERAEAHRRALGLPEERWRYRPDTFQGFHRERGYRLILSHSSVNHLDEPACERLLEDAGARQRYVELFRKVRDLLEPGGIFVLADVARRNYWATLGRPSPWAPEIEWHKHQEPETWCELLEEAGLEPIARKWYHPFYKARFIEPLLDNRVAARLLASNFVIRARRPLSAGGPSAP